jgi:hypothetical protein
VIKKRESTHTLGGAEETDVIRVLCCNARSLLVLQVTSTLSNPLGKALAALTAVISSVFVDLSGKVSDLLLLFLFW